MLADDQNWGVGYRWFLTFASGLLTLNSTFSSSIPSGIANALQAEFPLEGMPVSVLCISLVRLSIFTETSLMGSSWRAMSLVQ